MKILFLVPYPLKVSPSQRFRFEQYFKILSEKGISYHVQPFMSVRSWNFFFKPGNQASKLAAMLTGLLKRLSIFFSLARFDFVFIHREAFPIGPPVIEWVIARIWKKKIIYDFDDAIWLTDRSAESGWMKMLKWRNKVASICRWSYRISCGNQYLCDYAFQFNKHIVHNPTTVDTENQHNPLLCSGKIATPEIIVGWTGSHSTLKYLETAEEILQKIEQRFHHVKFMIIADRPPNLKLQRMAFVPWSIDDEIRQLCSFDIGIMPLPDDEWAKGKCGFKALQYMALGIPTIASPVGVNNTIISHGENGFLASSWQHWETSLTLLIQDPELRKTIGKKARKDVTERYSVSSNTDNFLSLFAS